MSGKTTIWMNDGDDQIEVTLPTRWCICGDCDGEGKSSAYLGAITASDRQPGGSWDDPDDFRDYMEGAYDRACVTCHGTGKIRTVDESRLTAEQLQAWREHIREEREHEAMCRAERRMGA